MRFLKILLLGVLGLIAGLGLGGLFLPSAFVVERSTTINAPAQKVYELVAAPKAWKGWSVWNQRDPAMKITYSGPESGVGAVWSWVSAQEGDGKMTFTAVQPDKQVVFSLYFPDFGTTSEGIFTFVPNGDATQVTWRMNGQIGGNPFYRWFGLFADKLAGADFEGGLKNLKALAEKP
jgi:uncharacterized protein YndB with AHSA1/START domain